MVALIGYNTEDRIQQTVVIKKTKVEFGNMKKGGIFYLFCCRYFGQFKFANTWGSGGVGGQAAIQVWRERATEADGVISSLGARGKKKIFWHRDHRDKRENCVQRGKTGILITDYTDYTDFK